jgi:hypothetical protein
MRRFVLLYALPLVASLHASAAHADSECDDDRPYNGSADITVQARPAGHVDVHVFAGSVRVTSGPPGAIHVRGHFSPECHLDVAPSGERQEIHLSCSHGPATGDVEVQVPQMSSVDVRTMSADVSFHDINGAVHAQTVAGNIELHGGTPTEIDLRSTSGDVTIQSSSTSTRAHSISGDVRISGVRGRASIRTVSGECTLSGGEFSATEIETVSGDVVFQGAIAGSGTFEAQSHSGEITLHLPATTAADVEMHSTSGELVIDMGSGRKSAEQELIARIGPGGSRLRLRSFSGDVNVLR